MKTCPTCINNTATGCAHPQARRASRDNLDRGIGSQILDWAARETCVDGGLRPGAIDCPGHRVQSGQGRLLA